MPQRLVDATFAAFNDRKHSIMSKAKVLFIPEVLYLQAIFI
jgi:hypothetical protein